MDAEDFVRFTERARRIVTYGEAEARRFLQNELGTPHLLLGLVYEEHVAIRILERLGIEPEQIRSEVERQITYGAVSPEGDLRMTPGARAVIDHAFAEARMLNNNYLGSEHLLLGLIQDDDGLAGRVLTDLGADLERTRHEVRWIQQGGAESERIAIMEQIYSELDPEAQQTTQIDQVEPSRLATDRLVAALKRSQATAARDRIQETTIEYLIGALLDGPGSAADLLSTAKVDRQAVEKRLPLPEMVNVDWPGFEPGRVRPQLSADAVGCIVHAERIARNAWQPSVQTAHVLAAAALVHEAFGQALHAAGLNRFRLLDQMADMHDEEA
jgi:ATP-dependent Clp protease ATP-binding subunit ClpA